MHKTARICTAFPRDGWVEHDPMEIVSSQIGVLEEAVDAAGIPLDKVAGIGITNQRETTVVWEKETGKPIYNAIVWQCRRTAAICEQLKRDGLEDYIKETTGLVIDAYFSATKVKWILDHVDGRPFSGGKRRTVVWDSRYVATLEPYERQGARDGLHQCIPHDDVQYQDTPVG